MSSGEGDGTNFWCHQCRAVITPVQGVDDDVLCPQCHGGFVEEMENPQPPPPPGREAGGAPRPMIITGGGLGAEDFMNQFMESVNTDIFGPDQGGGGASAGGAAVGLGPLNPMMVLSYLQNMLGAAAPRGNIQIIFDNTGGGGGGGLRFPGAVGDYYLGGGLEQLIQQLMENDPNRYGTPPASKAAVEGMPTIKITQNHLNSDAAQCAVCKDKFDEGANARQMPCKHIYHEDCILPWLELHSTCPVCRYEMPTDDSSRNPQNPSNAATSASEDSNPGGAAGGGGGRRLRFQVPLRFRTGPPPPQQGGSSSEQGGAGSTPANNPGNNNNNDGNNSSEARQEDLD